MSAFPLTLLTQNDVFFAIVVAAIIFLVCKVISAVYHMSSLRASIIPYTPGELDSMLDTCYRAFPIESFDFKGNTLRRGTTVRVTTTRQVIIEGQFMGRTESEVLCFLTDTCMIAQTPNAIQEIQIL